MLLLLYSLHDSTLTLKRPDQIVQAFPRKFKAQFLRLFTHMVVK